MRIRWARQASRPERPDRYSGACSSGEVAMNVTPKAVPTKVFAAMPERFLKKRRNAWTDANRGGEAVGCFLEGPSFDRDGNLYVTDIPFGRVFRISPDGADWTQVAEYDGWPNGLKIHKDGRI